MFSHHSDAEKGYSLLEVVIAIMIMGIALVPIVDSFANSNRLSTPVEERVLIVNHARAKMEELLAMNFSDLPVSGSVTPSNSLSDTVTVLGRTVDRNVYVETYDGDENKDTLPDFPYLPDSNLKKITVQVKDVRFQTLKSAR